VVQEALTNAARHAPGARVQVRVDGAEDALEIAVLSSGGRAARSPGGGSGLVGMRERVTLHGGRLETGPTADGFAVTARLPLALPATP
jgi:signal transduction histidine kinase